MKTYYLLAIDAGTGSIRALLFDTQAKQVALAQKEWTHLQEEGVKDSMGFDIATNWELVRTCIKEVLQTSGVNPKDILALSATSMREGIILYDKEGKAIWGVANVDARADKEVRELKEEFVGIEEAFYAQSGQTFALGALPRLLWLKKHRPEIYEKAASLSMIGDWILAQLSGVIASDPSNGGTTGVFDLEKRDWARHMAQKVGIKTELFPTVYEVGEVIGHVTAAMSKQTGLSTTTKVVMGGGDVQLGAAGLGVVDVGDVAILGGSFWQQVVNIPSHTKPPKSMEIRINPHVVKGVSQAEGITFFSGLVMRWFRDAFCAFEVEEAQKRGMDVYTLLEEKAAQVPAGSYGILPIFSDEMRYGKWYHASPSLLNLGLDADKYNTASIFRALQENAAIVSSINLEKIKHFSGVEFSSITFAGGASKGDLWPQIVADVTGYEVKIPEIKEATALGASIAAGVGAGLYESIEKAAKKLVKWEKSYRPNPQNKTLYDALKKEWQKAYSMQLKLVDEGICTSMWQAPGV